MIGYVQHQILSYGNSWGQSVLAGQLRYRREVSYLLDQMGYLGVTILKWQFCMCPSPGRPAVLLPWQ